MISYKRDVLGLVYTAGLDAQFRLVYIQCFWLYVFMYLHLPYHLKHPTCVGLENISEAPSQQFLPYIFIPHTFRSLISTKTM